MLLASFWLILCCIPNEYRVCIKVPDITNYTMNGHTYRYYHGDPLYPFGYGLSYTQFTYSHLAVSPQTVVKGQSITVKVTVNNIGHYDADEVSSQLQRLMGHYNE